MSTCPLCRETSNDPAHVLGTRSYFQCRTCGLIFLIPSQRLSADQERARYEKHQNHGENLGYREFLSPLVEELVTRLNPGAKGLDFGSGPGPVLPELFRIRGFQVQMYDPFFASHPHALECRYDFIACSETIEHIYDPSQIFVLFRQLLHEKGWLGIMTQCFDTWADFSVSAYQRDPTHVCIYSQRVLRWIGQNLGWEVQFPRANLALLKKISANRAT